MRGASLSNADADRMSPRDDRSCSIDTAFSKSEVDLSRARVMIAHVLILSVSPLTAAFSCAACIALNVALVTVSISDGPELKPTDRAKKSVIGSRTRFNAPETSSAELMSIGTTSDGDPSPSDGLAVSRSTRLSNTSPLRLNVIDRRFTDYNPHIARHFATQIA
jgi:hypothetical protein